MDKKQNQPLELEELDLALPDDLNLGEADVDSGFDDLELPELTADDDLGDLGSAETHASEDMHSGQDSMAEAESIDTGLHEAAPPAMDEDEEPIALSEEELERIVKESLGSSGATDVGKAMGAAMKAVAGRADGNAVREIVQRLLASPG